MHPDLVLLDLNLPGIAGKEVLREMRAEEVLATIPVVALTTSSAEEDIRGCYELGANSYIVKPLRLEEHLAALTALSHYWFETVRLPQVEEGTASELSHPLTRGLHLIDIVAPGIEQDSDSAHPGAEGDAPTAVVVVPADVEREADIAVRITAKPHETLVGRKFATLAYAVYGRKGVQPKAWIGWTYEEETPLWVKRDFPDLPLAFRVSASLTKFAAVQSGAGISQLACYYGDLDDSLERLTEPELYPGWDIWVLTHEDLRKTARVRKVLDDIGYRGWIMAEGGRTRDFAQAARYLRTIFPPMG